MEAAAQQISVVIPERDVRASVERVANEIAADPAMHDAHMVTIMQGGLWFSEALQDSRALAGRFADQHKVTARRTVTDGELGPVRIDPGFGERTIPTLAGKSVLLVDDVLDEGKTLQALFSLIEPVAATLRSAVLIRRTRPEGHAIEPDFVGIDAAESGWLVGCGMDSEGHYRDLPYIGVRGSKAE